MPKYIDADALRKRMEQIAEESKPAAKARPMREDTPSELLRYGTARAMIEWLDEIPAADVEPKRNWISVTERLPEPKRKHYLCYLDDDSIAVCYWSNVSIRGNKWEWHNPNWKEVTHWMPLPEPPKGEDDA